MDARNMGITLDAIMEAHCAFLLILSVGCPCYWVNVVVCLRIVLAKMSLVVGR